MEVTDTKNEDVGTKYQDKIAQINESVSKINAATGEDKTKLDPILTSSSNLRREAEDGMGRYDQMQQDWQKNEQTDTETAKTTTEEKGDKDFYDTADDENVVLKKQAADDVAEAEETYLRIQKYADRAHRNLISATKQIYSARLKKMEDSMDRLVKTRQVGNIRQGRDRYAPELATGILTDQELTGHERLSDIEGQMLSAIAEADKAKAKGDLEAFNGMLKNVEGIMDRMNTQIKENYNIAKERDKALRDQEKEARVQQQQEFDNMLDKSKRAAPALADKLDGLSPEQQVAVVEEYSKLAGVDMDVLLGDIATAAQDRDYKNLQVENLQNQIYNRNRDTNIAAQREARLQREENNTETKEEKFTDYTENIVEEAQTLNDVPEKDRAKVISEMRRLGYYSDEPPSWFIGTFEEKYKGLIEAKGGGLRPDVIRKKWNEMRLKAIEIKEEETV